MIRREDIRTAAQERGDSTRPRRRHRRSRLVAEVLDLPAMTADALREATEVQDRRPEVARIGGDWVHVSSLLGTDFCPRRHWLARFEGRPIQQRAGGAQRVVWAMGRAAEHHVRQQLLVTMRHRAFGLWACDCQQTTTQGFFDQDATCSGCGSQVKHYGEHPLLHSSVTGSPDFVVLNENDEMVVLEIKSIQKKDFEPLTEPASVHVRQAQFYIHLLHELGFSVHSVPIIYYVCKDYIVRQSTYKVFEGPRVNLANPSAEIRLSFQDAEAAAGEELPDRLPVCHSCDSVVAARCPFVGACFAMT